MQKICDDDTIDFEKYYKIPFKCTIESKARSFQYKINHNIYFTNEKLFKINKIPSPRCESCGNIETLKHIFVECIEVQKFWDHFLTCWGEELNIIILTATEILLGYLGNNPSQQILNHLLIIAKQHISFTRWKCKKTNFIEYKYRVKYIQQIEHNIAKRKSKMPEHVRKWSQICLP